MSQTQKKYIYYLGKKFLKKTKPDSVWWFTKLTSKIILGAAWAKIKGDNWYDKIPGDKGYLWFKKRELDTLLVHELYIGRFMIGIAKTKVHSSNDLLVAIEDFR